MKLVQCDKCGKITSLNGVLDKDDRTYPKFLISESLDLCRECAQSLGVVVIPEQENNSPEWYELFFGIQEDD